MSVLSHPVSAPRGATMSCNGWPQEAALRLLMNHLDSHAAWRPDDRVVYAAPARPAHRPSAVGATVAALPADAEYPEALAAVRPSGVDMSLGAMDMNATYRAGGQAQ